MDVAVQTFDEFHGTRGDPDAPRGDLRDRVDHDTLIGPFILFGLVVVIGEKMQGRVVGAGQAGAVRERDHRRRIEAAGHRRADRNIGNELLVDRADPARVADLPVPTSGADAASAIRS